MTSEINLELVGVHASPSRLGVNLLHCQILAKQIAAGGKIVIIDKDSSLNNLYADIKQLEPIQASHDTYRTKEK